MWGVGGVGQSKWNRSLLGLVRPRLSSSRTKTRIIACGLQFNAAVLGLQGGSRPLEGVTPSILPKLFHTNPK